MTERQIEYRDVNGAEAAVSSGVIVGRATPFNSQTMIGEAPWGFREQIQPGAFTKTLNEADVVYLVNHDSNMPLARTSAGTLTLRQTDKGLEFEATPADTSYARDLMENIRAKNIQGNSFGFQVVKDSWSVGDDGVDERTIHEVKLMEISSCTFPAYADTEVSMRDVVSAIKERRGKYNAEQLKEMLAKGEAFKNAAGDPSYPIADREDLENAIHAVGRGGADHDAIRKYIMGRAKALGLSNLIPSTWNSDGSVDGQKSVPAGGTEDRHSQAAAEAAIKPNPEHLECIAAIDAALDEAMKYFCAADRDSLPADINQAIDLVASAAHNVGSLMSDKGIPDPDKPNGASYSGEGKPADATSEPRSVDLSLYEMQLDLLKRKAA